MAGGWRLDPHQALPHSSPTSGHSRAAKGAGEAPGAPPPLQGLGLLPGGQVSLQDRQGQVWPKGRTAGPLPPSPAALPSSRLSPAASL